MSLGNERSITVLFRSNVTDEMWQRMCAEIEETVEQAACDYAAACEDDEYEVTFVFASE